MKYWRGYLVAAIVAAFTWGLIKFAEAHTVLIDMIYPYVTRMLVASLADWSSAVDVCLWQVFALLLGVGVLASIVLMILLRWNPIQWFGWLLAIASCVYMLHTAIYGLNYYAGDLADDIHLEVRESTVTELKEATIFYRDQANALANKIDRNADGTPQYPSFEELAEQVGEGFHILTYEKSIPIFAGSTVPVKKLGWSDMYTSMGISGFTFALTGEAAVNPQMPSVSLPFTMCHEMAHRMSIASEQDANFAAFLACSVNPSTEIQYSAYFMAYRYCYNALASVGTSTAREAAEQVKDGLNDNFRQDLADYNAFLSSSQKQEAVNVATTVNDTYLKTSGEEQGTASYGMVCDLLVSWHIQEYVLPLHADQEVSFDPYDETQVDLSGIVNAPVQE